MSHIQADPIRQLLSHKPGFKAQQIADELGLDRARSGHHAPLPCWATTSSRITHTAGGRKHAAAGVTANGARPPARRTPAWQPMPVLPGDPVVRKRSGISIPARRYARLCCSERATLRPTGGQALGDRPRGQENRAESAAGAGPTRALSRLSDPCPIRTSRETKRRCALSRCCSIRSRKRRRSRPSAPARQRHPAFQSRSPEESLPAVDSGNVMDEAIHLSEELGLANAEDELPPWDEIILRLPALPSGLGMEGGSQSLRALHAALRWRN